MTLSEHTKAKLLCDEYHKNDPDWELIRELICDLAGYKLKPFVGGSSISVDELLKAAEPYMILKLHD